MKQRSFHSLLARALNFSVGFQKYTLIFITHLCVLSRITCAMETEEASVQTAVCGFRKTKTGKYT